MGSSLDSNSQTRNFSVYFANSHKLETRIQTRESRFSAILKENLIVFQYFALRNSFYVSNFQFFSSNCKTFFDYIFEQKFL